MLSTTARRFCLSSIVLLTALLATLATLAIANAQSGSRRERPLLEPGHAVVTGFPGTTQTDRPAPAGQQAPAAGDPSELFINPDGASLRILDLRYLGARAGDRRRGAVEVMAWPARDIGQVFGIALDIVDRAGGGVPGANIYVAATSAFGLQLVRPDANGGGWPQRVIHGGPDVRWMDGQWGGLPGGGPGTIWKIDGMTGRVSALAELSANGQPNSGPGLGNITYDPVSRHLFASDLDSGLIHRIDLGGQEVSVYDHGVEGRRKAGLEELPDPGDRADLTSELFRADDPATWGFTPPGRRVWGVKVYSGRLYYAVADGPEIWSVRIERDGGFADARREIVIPQDVEPWEVSDITFTTKGWMLLAQRPPVTGNQDYVFLASPAPARVLRYLPEGNGWRQAPDEYAVGLFPEHRMTSGGVAVGYGYKRHQDDRFRELDYQTCEEMLWVTGDDLAHTRRDLQTVAARRDEHEGFIAGLQGSPLELVRPRNVPPEEARFVDYDGRYPAYNTRGQLGDVEVFKIPCEQKVVPEYRVNHAEEPCPGCRPQLYIEKREIGRCTRGGLCRFEIIVTNNSDDAYSGPLILYDQLSQAGATLVNNGPSSWVCSQGGIRTSCSTQGVLLRPGASISLWLTFRLPSDWSSRTFKNCVWLVGLGNNTPDDALLWVVQLELARLGYYTGPIDGIMGPKTESAIGGYEKDNGRDATGGISPWLVNSLFGTGAWLGDGRWLADQSCATHRIASELVRGPVFTPLPEVTPLVTPRWHPRLVSDPIPHCGRNAYWNGETCVGTCPYGTYNYLGRCMPVCGGGQAWNGFSCVCTGGREWDHVAGRCRYVEWIPLVPRGCYGNQIRTSSGCVCPGNTVWSNSKGWCVAFGDPRTCPPGSHWVPSRKECVRLVDIGRDLCLSRLWDSNGNCILRTDYCPRGQVPLAGGGCGCGSGTIAFQGRCLPIGTIITVVGAFAPPKNGTVTLLQPTGSQPVGTTILRLGPAVAGQPGGQGQQGSQNRQGGGASSQQPGGNFGLSCVAPSVPQGGKCIVPVKGPIGTLPVGTQLPSGGQSGSGASGAGGTGGKGTGTLGRPGTVGATSGCTANCAPVGTKSGGAGAGTPTPVSTTPAGAAGKGGSGAGGSGQQGTAGSSTPAGSGKGGTSAGSGGQGTGTGNVVCPPGVNPARCGPQGATGVGGQQGTAGSAGKGGTGAGGSSGQQGTAGSGTAGSAGKGGTGGTGAGGSSGQQGTAGSAGKGGTGAGGTSGQQGTAGSAGKGGTGGTGAGGTSGQQGTAGSAGKGGTGAGGTSGQQGTAGSGTAGSAGKGGSGQPGTAGGAGKGGTGGGTSGQQGTGAASSSSSGSAGKSGSSSGGSSASGRSGSAGGGSGSAAGSSSSSSGKSGTAASGSNSGSGGSSTSGSSSKPGATGTGSSSRSGGGASASSGGSKTGSSASSGGGSKTGSSASSGSSNKTGSPATSGGGNKAGSSGSSGSSSKTPAEKKKTCPQGQQTC